MFLIDLNSFSVENSRLLLQFMDQLNVEKTNRQTTSKLNISDMTEIEKQILCKNLGMKLSENLRVDYKGLTEIPTSISQLTHLQTLNFTNNKITEIPTSIRQLTKLQTLWLSNNKITRLPTWLCELKELHTLEIDGNPVTLPPKEICRQGTFAIFDYLKEYSLGAEEWKAIKIITIGDAGNGKVSILGVNNEK